MNEVASSILPKSDPQQQAPTNNTSTTLASVPEHDDSIASFSERFASLVSEIDRETEAALEFARSEETSSRHTLESPLSGRRGGGGDGSDDELEDNPAYTHRPLHSPGANADDDDDDDFYRGGEPSSTSSRPRVPVPPSLGYNEFGQPYPPDEDYQMFDRFIKRMPTIESMGSRELGSAGTASLLSARDANHDGNNKRGSLQTNKSHNTNNSRPPTRNAPRGSWVGSEFSFNSGTSASEPSSRTNSLSFQVEKLAAMGFLGGGGSSSGHGTSEYGELLDVGHPGVRRVIPESPLRTEFGAPDSLTAPERPYSSATNRSGSTDVSYFTATTGSAKTGKSGVQQKEERKEGDEAS
ncbi:hypothetical protein H1R20_g5286, partial [Candolleomyces eurysporus]